MSIEVRLFECGEELEFASERFPCRVEAGDVIQFDDDNKRMQLRRVSSVVHVAFGPDEGHIVAFLKPKGWKKAEDLRAKALADELRKEGWADSVIRSVFECQARVGQVNE
ncbi:hypothetical protein LCGC14_0273080 [marine sediment metagenome]|uniref:Uncharacterized protein n=2 Tax=root TaxID=1 RepID=A0A9C9TFV0_9HYPH|nr:hypothetical protein [Aurantimonas coralicida]